MKIRVNQPTIIAIAEETAASPAQKSGSRRKIALVIITLSIMGFFIIKLQKAESQTASVASALVIQKKEESPAAERVTKTGNKKKEVLNHARSVRANIRWRKNLVGETVLEGTLTNTSKGVGVKDPVLVVTWLSKTNTHFATTNYSIPAILEAKASMPYKLKVKAPGKYAALKVSVESVTAL